MTLLLLADGYIKVKTFDEVIDVCFEDFVSLRAKVWQASGLQDRWSLSKEHSY
jgi:hypothetical protein